ncbi:hypothetical protein RYX36_028047 [Vicia faba]
MENESGNVGATEPGFTSLPMTDGEHDGTNILIEINSARHDSLNRSLLVQKDASLLRDLRIMAYFRRCFPSDSNISTIKELAHSLTSHCPYQVPIASLKIRHVHREVPSSEIFYSLNASIVGLVVESEGPENSPWCLGLGIVKGIDTVKGSGVYFTVHVSECIDCKLVIFS